MAYREAFWPALVMGGAGAYGIWTLGRHLRGQVAGWWILMWAVGLLLVAEALPVGILLKPTGRAWGGGVALGLGAVLMALGFGMMVLDYLGNAGSARPHA